MPRSAADAKRRFEAHLARLAAEAPRAGLGAATGDFIVGLAQRDARYGDHLFHCFADRRIPATTNELEGFFGSAKRLVRRAAGAGSTTNSVVTNLGAHALIAFHEVARPDFSARLDHAELDAGVFIEARRCRPSGAPACPQKICL